MPITVTAQPTNSPPRVQINVTGLTDATTTIMRNDPDGRTRPVRAAEPATLTSGTWLGYDYEAPFGMAVTYTSLPPTNPAETSNADTLTVPDVWLVHPGVPDVSVRVDPQHVMTLDDRSRTARAAVLQPLGRATPIVVSETRSSVQSGLTVITDTLTDRDAMWAVLAGGSALLLNVPPSLDWGVTWEYVSIGDVSESYVAGGASESRIFALPYTVVDRPIGSLQAQWTYAGLLGKYTTYGDTLAHYATYADALANNSI